MCSSVQKLALKEIKHNVLLTLCASISILALTYIIFGIENLENITVSYIVERFLPFIGIICLGNIYYPEDELKIKDIIKIKNKGLLKVYVVRFVIRLVVYLLLTYLYLKLIYRNNNLVGFNHAFFLSTAIGIFVSGLGLLVYGITKNIVISYILMIVYILSQWFNKNKLKGIYLSGLWRVSNKDIFYFMVLGLILHFVSYIIWSKRRI